MSVTPAQLAYDSILQALRTRGKPINKGINNAYLECPNHNEPVELYVQIKNSDQVGMRCNKRCMPSKVMTALGLNGYATANGSTRAQFFAEEVEREAHRIRVRDAAQRKIRKEKRPRLRQP
jgi:hypothetical protein